MMSSRTELVIAGLALVLIAFAANDLVGDRKAKVAAAEQERLEALPASLWFEAHDLYVPDAVVGDDFHMELTRDINRPFRGEWKVQLRSHPELTTMCPAEGATEYNPGAQLPEPLRWSWIAWPDCSEYRPPAGQYKVFVQWAIDAGEAGIKHETVESNVFTVFEVSPQEQQRMLQVEIQELQQQVLELKAQTDG